MPQPSYQANEAGIEVTWRLPAAFLYLSGPDVASRDWKILATRLEQLLPGLHTTAPGMLACTPADATSDLLDTALGQGLRLLRQTQTRELPTLSHLVLLVIPGYVESKGERLSVDDRDPLVQALLDQPTLPLDPGLYVTSRAVHALEGTWELQSAGTWSTSRLPDVPLHRATDTPPHGLPRSRNPEIFDRVIEWVPRRQLEKEVSEGLSKRQIQIHGPLGSGKSRLVAEVLKRTSDITPITVTPSRTRDPIRTNLVYALDRLLQGAFSKKFAELQSKEEDSATEAKTNTLFGSLLASVLQTKQLCIVFDDLQRASKEDLFFVRSLMELQTHSEQLSLVLVGRSSSGWDLLPPRRNVVLVPYLSSDESSIHAARVCEGLEMPQEVLDRFCASAAGSPFCFEEGILGLIHRRALRRVYGSFFFGAPNDIDITASPRFVAHLISETRSSRTTFGLTALAAAEGAVPTAAIEAVSQNNDHPMSPSWTNRSPVSDWIVGADSPWGPGFDFGPTALRYALDSILSQESRRRLRSQLGQWLGTLPDLGPEALWKAYQLMSGQPGAVEILLQTLRPLPPADRREAIFAAVCFELAELRKRGGSEDEEIRVLWALLPLARQMGRLRDIRRELDRARVLCKDAPEKLLAILTLLSEFDIDDGNPRAAEASLRQAIEIAMTSDPRRKPLLAVQLGRLLQRQGRFEETRNLLERLLEEITAVGGKKNTSMAATCRFYLGNTALSQRRFQDALKLHRSAYLARKEHQLVGVIGASLCALGATQRALGDYRQALDYFEKARVHLLSHGRDGEVGYALMGLASIRSRLGQSTYATPLLRDAVTVRAEHEGNVGEALSRLALAENLLDLEQLASAQEEGRRAHFCLTLVESSPHLGRAERLLGRLQLRHQNNPTARNHFRRALKLHKDQGSDEEIARDLSWLLVEAQDRRCREDVELLVRQLAEIRSRVEEFDRSELLDYRLFSALTWLSARGSQVPIPPIQFLRRAYRDLLRRTSNLEPEQRSSYLMQVPEHQWIVAAATKEQLSLPELM